MKVHPTSVLLRTQNKSLIGLLKIISLSLVCVWPVSAQTVDSRLGQLEFQSGYPTDQTVQHLYDELDFQRAVQAYLWAMPMASYGAMAEAQPIA